jgi:4-alpha-glucanotransferase
MNIEHNSREKFYRRPFGAVPCGTVVRFRIAASGIGIPNAVRFVYKKDGAEEERVDMAYLFDLGENCIYSVKVKMPDEVGLIWYYFEIETAQGTFYYGNNSRNLGGKGELSFDKPSHSFQITIYDKNYKTPDWFKEGIAYQIFVDRFYNGNEDGSFLGDRDDIIKREWGDAPFYKPEQFGGEYKANDFFGGNLRGVIKKLPYLSKLGITVIYLNPIFKAYSNHKYDTGSYEMIDPMFGNEDDFKELCAEAKKLGIRIILDGVFNHTGSDSQYFNKKGTYDSVGAYQSQDSPYYNWYRFMEWPDIYESWWGMTTLPQVEEHSEEYRKYILSGENAIVKKWIRNGASGWRLDVVDELPGFFVKELRENVKSVDKDAVIIGEVWEDASNKSAYGERREYFLGKELDSVMNYPMRTALIDAVLGKIEAQELDDRLMSLKENYPKQAYYSLLNMISSHDVERVLTMMGGVPSRHDVDKEYQANFKLDGYGLEVAWGRATLILGLQMTLPGVPCIYYGDEIGMQGYGDPFCRQCYPWGKEDEIDPTGVMRERYKNMIALRKMSKAFTIGEFESVYKIGRVYAFIRQYDDEKYIVVANMDVKDAQIRLDVARFGITKMTCVSADEEVKESSDGIHFIDMPQLWIKAYRAE